MTKRIIAHIGSGKTGSSAIQTALAQNIDTLAALGLHYPVTRKVRRAQEGRISSGNIPREDFVESCRAYLADLPEDKVLLISNEGLGRLFRDTPEVLAELLLDDVEMRAIYYVREPFSWQESAYVQNVKRGGMSGSFADYLCTRNEIADNIRTIEALAAHGVATTVLNYSVHRHRHVARFSEALGLPCDALGPASGQAVNRSLTRAETELLRRMNAVMPREQTARLADALCNQLPGLPSDPPAVTRDTFEGFMDRQRPDIARLNALLPESERIVPPGFDEIARGVPDPAEEGLRFTPEQLDVLVDFMAPQVIPDLDRAAAKALARAIRPGHSLTRAEAGAILTILVGLLPEAKGIRRRRDRFANGQDPARGSAQ